MLQTPFHWWRKKNLLQYQNVSKYCDHDCSIKNVVGSVDLIVNRNTNGTRNTYCISLWDLSYNLNLALNSFLSSWFLIVNLRNQFWNPGISMESFSFLHVCLYLLLSNGRQILNLVFMILTSSLSVHYLQMLRFPQ